MTREYDDNALVEHFTGTCCICKKHVDGRRHNAVWNPVTGLAHSECASAKKQP